MKQVLLRMDDELHARIAALAKREQRSVNAIANEVLAMVVAADERRSEPDRVRARAAALGMLAPEVGDVTLTQDAEELRRRAIESMRGAGAMIDRILDEDRERS
jgi:hypothetical protein